MLASRHAHLGMLGGVGIKDSPFINSEVSAGESLWSDVFTSCSCIFLLCSCLVAFCEQFSIWLCMDIVGSMHVGGVGLVIWGACSCSGLAC